MASAPTRYQLHQLAFPAAVSHDRAAGCYRATAPYRHRWGSGPHELCAWYDDCTAAEARAFLAEALRGEALEACEDPDCDWCRDVLAEARELEARLASARDAQPRDEAGRYYHRYDRLCVCGHTLGCHTAVRGRQPDGTLLQPCVDAEDCDCALFTPNNGRRR